MDAGAYEKSFPQLKSGTVVYDPMNTLHQGADLTTHSADFSARAEIKSKINEDRENLALNLIARTPALKSIFNFETKSFTAGMGGAGSTDFVMNPLSLDRDIVDTSRKQTPMRAMIRRVTNNGIKALYNVIESKQTATFQTELEAQVVSDFAPTRSDVDIKIIRVSGYVSGFAQASVPSFNLQDIQGASSEFGNFTGAVGSTAMDQNVLTATRAIQEFEESSIFNGSIANDAKEFDGIIQLQGATNVTAISTITLDALDNAYFDAYSAGGQPNVAVCDVQTYKKVKQLLQAKGGFLEYKDVGVYGFKGLMIKTGDTDIPLIPSRFLSTQGGSQRLYMLDLSVWEVRVLMDRTFEMLAKVDDGQKFMIKMYECLIDKSNGAFNSGISGMNNV